MDDKDYYLILQVASDASNEEIKTSYRRLALEHHPDRTGDLLATERMQQINEAYAILVDPLKRELYDLEVARKFDEALAAFDREQVEREDPDRTQEIVVSKEQIEKKRSWARGQLKYISWIFLVTMGLFLWTLITDQVNFAILILLVAISLQIVLSIVIKVRDVPFPGKANPD